MSETSPPTRNFIRDIIEADLASGATGGRVVTRFPPEPNGYLHIGHAKAICLDFGLAADYGGVCHLRFDDTNPETEDPEFVQAIQDDVRWLGFDWGEHLHFASDYFGKFYEFAEELIADGLAYVDSQTEEEIRLGRGTVTEPGTNSPYRERTVAQNLDLFRRMRAGEFADGEHVLRARGDMASTNMKMRDPLLYRIRHVHHYRTGDEWPIYPMYDFAHPLGDAIENITHSLCTLEFENNREVYDWVVGNTHEPPVPHQYEFSRLNLTYTVMSKRKLLRLVNEGYVTGWDDPRMLTIAGLRRRGFTPSSIRSFVERAGVSKSEQRVDMGLLEYSIRDDLNAVAPRVMCVVDPLPVTITNWPDGKVDWIDAPYYPHDVPREGSRKVPFSGELYIERDDFRVDPPKGYYRLAPGAEVRLRYGYVVRCEDVVRGADGSIERVLCTYDPESRGGDTADGRRIRGTIHWVSASEAKRVEVRLYDRLFSHDDPESVEEGYLSTVNPDSVVIRRNAYVEPSVSDDPSDMRYQFERQGYFWRDPKDSSPEAPVFNRIVALKDTWARMEARATAKPAAQPAAKPTAKPATNGDTDPAATASTRPASRNVPADVRAVDVDRLVAEFGLAADDATVLASHPGSPDLLASTVAAGAMADKAANWIINELPAALSELGDGGHSGDHGNPRFSGAELAELISLVETGEVSGRAAKTVLVEMVRTGERPRAAVDRLGLRQVSDADELAKVAAAVVDAFPEKVADYRSGKTGLIGFFVGQVMQRTGGAGNPQLARETLERLLG